MVEKMPLTSEDIRSERISRLREDFPEVFTEGKVDFEKLKQALGDEVSTDRERYGLSWAGKAEAIRNVQTPSVATLVPDREESVEFDTTENLFIEGDNLEVLKLLQKSYHGLVKMIYVDPPYNTGNEFIYPDNFREGIEDYLRYSGQVNGDGVKLSTNTETSGRYHSKWLNMMYPRLFLARNLLREDGVIFVSIDDHEAHNLRLMMDEVFGEDNFVVSIAWKKATGSNDIQVAYVHETLHLYRRSPSAEIGRLPRTEKQLGMYSNPDNDPRGDWASDNYASKFTPEERPTLYYPVTNPFTGKKVWPKKGQTWRCSKETHRKNEQENRLWWGSKGELEVPRYKRFLSEVQEGVVPRSLWDDVGTNEHGRSEFLDLGFYKGDFDNPKPTALIKRTLRLGIGQNTDGIVLDFFAGSATTAHAVLQQNREDGGDRKFITVQLPEPTDNPNYPTIADIGKERIRRVIKKLDEEDDDRLKVEDEPLEDRGFKIFKLTSSNFKIWDGAKASKESEDMADRLWEFAENMLPDRSQEDILYEILLKSGFPLTAQVERLELARREVYSVSGGLLFICLEDHVDEGLMREVAEYEPERFVCLDSAFNGNDKLKTNTKLQMEDRRIEFRTV